MKVCKKGEQVLLTQAHIDKIFSILITEINRIGKIYYEQDPKFTLDVPLHVNGPLTVAEGIDSEKK